MASPAAASPSPSRCGGADPTGILRIKTDVALSDGYFDGVARLKALDLYGAGAESVVSGSHAEAAFVGDAERECGGFSLRWRRRGILAAVPG
ncbi:hypothetical protein JMJ55_15185 [Belnapia sp. T6]|uniref:Uncharacterized protein n=1 Tax=Belnapia mucosa TaxID=2804532 RepID=A0ABS1V4Q2_9PROT|nr:hypothetical protein [Belnapia mucosa]MBL6456678.1 hypothetical protein [Belnapia mucosa]